MKCKLTNTHTDIPKSQYLHPQKGASLYAQKRDENEYYKGAY